MFPTPRPSARATSSAASSPRTNSHRHNNDRDERQPGRMAERSSSFDVAPSMSRTTSDSGSDLASQNSDPTGRRYKDLAKVNQILQQFFGKSALIILGSRVILPQAFDRNGERRTNKWFNILLDESDQLIRQIMEWKTMNIEEERPPPLVIEVYLDLAELAPSQSLVTIDDEGRRWDVADALNPQSTSNARAPGRSAATSQLVIERWEISLDEIGDDGSSEKDVLAVVYKQCVPLIRSLYTYARLLPAFKYCRRLARQTADKPALKPKYRILSGDVKPTRKETLNVPLSYPEGRVTEKYEFEPQLCPVGTLGISVVYRTKCDFRIDDAESLLSSHFMADDRYFRPSLHDRRDHAAVPSSVPTSRKEFHDDGRDQGQVYGSLSTFHKSGVAAPGTSPLSAMRAMRDDDSTPSSTTPAQKMPPNHRTATGSKSSLRSEAGPSYPRRPSVSFQPFKAGSLASSPAFGMQVLPSPSTSLGRPSGLNPLAQARNRNSLTTLPQQALRAPSLANDTAIASSASSSPKPAPITRYSSSFSHRRSRFSSDGGSRVDHEQNSSGRPSPSSSTPRGSDMANEDQGGSSGSMQQTDDDHLKDFLRLLESKKELKSFSNDSATRDVSMRRTTAALNKYQRMRDTNSALSDSMSSSLLLHRSSSSSSRQLSSVPPMIRGTSVSTSSSPGQPVSPHTPHTPAIPSRLSANSIVDYGEARRSRSHGRRDVETTREENSSDTTTRDTGTNAIDIPTSPRAWPYARRSSSVSQQQQRALEDEPDLYGIRSASMPTEDRTEPSISELLRVTETNVVAAEDDQFSEPQSSSFKAYPFPSSRPENVPERSRPTVASLPRRVQTSRGGRGSPSLSSDSQRGSRYSAGSRASTAPEEDELMFHFSELGGGSRRSIEDGRGGGASGSSTVERRRGSPWH